MEEQNEGQNFMNGKEEDVIEASESKISGTEAITVGHVGQEVSGMMAEAAEISSEPAVKNAENTEQAFSGYTGEYGNRVAGEYNRPEQTTYSFSYKNGGGESTHSGDYYADRKDAGGSWMMDQHQDQGQYQNQYQSQNHDQSQRQDRNQNQGYPDPSYFGNGYGQQASSGHENKPKEKKEVSFGKRLFLTAVCAVVFGLIASACFIGINYVYQVNYGSQKADMADGTEEIKKTTDVGNSGVKEEQKSIIENQVPSQVGTTDVSSIVEQMMPAVVAITSTTKGTAYYDLFGQYYAGQDTTSAGTGFIVGKNEKELLIATNNHVISKAKTISVQFFDGEIYKATEKGSDSANDLAVVAVKMADVKKSTIEKIRVADLGDSDKAKVGEMVIAIGNALGYGQSVTVGYISAKDREITEESENGSAGNKIKALQTDAAINPGNSGGALINMQGQVIGINSAKIASSQVEGVGYAIPISVATPIIDDLMKREALKDNEKGYLGISGTTVSEAATMYNVPLGVYVKEVSKGGAADLAGIKENDIITAVNNMQVTTMESLKDKVNSYRVGTKVEITFQRSSDGEYKEQKVTVTLKDQSSTDGLTDNAGKDQNFAPDGDDNDARDNGSDDDRSYGGDSNGFGDLWDFFR